MKELWNKAVDNFSDDVVSIIDNTFDEISEMAPAFEKVEDELVDCQRGSELFIPITKLANVHNKVVELDKKILNLETKVEIPMIDYQDMETMLEIQITFENFLTSFCRRPLRKAISKDPKPEPSQQNKEYVPNLFRYLRLAVIQDDISMFRNIIENPNMPPRSLVNILKFRLESNLDNNNDSGDGTNDSNKCSLLILAAINRSENILRYLIHLEGIDLLELFKGFNIVNYLLNFKHVPESVVNLIEEIFELQPKLVDSINCDGSSMLQTFSLLGQRNLCRTLIEKYGVNVNKPFPNKSTPLILAIQLKDKPLFDLFMSLGASLAVTGRYKNSTLHVACQIDWPEPIYEILREHSDMVEWQNEDEETPVFVTFASDSLNILQSLSECQKLEVFATAFKTKKNMLDLAQDLGAKRIIDWLNSFD